jgi:uncharacterized protein
MAEADQDQRRARPSSTAGSALHLRAAMQRVPRRAARAAVKLYRLIFSPLVGFHCRHLPSCSQYSDEAIDRFGLWAGGWMTLARLMRCQPWGTSGLDFVPQTPPAGARWYLPWRYGRWRGGNLVPAPPPPSP